MPNNSKPLSVNGAHEPRHAVMGRQVGAYSDHRVLSESLGAQFLGASPNPGQIMLVTEYLPRGDLWRALSKDSQHVFSWYRRCGPQHSV